MFSSKVSVRCGWIYAQLLRVDKEIHEIYLFFINYCSRLHNRTHVPRKRLFEADEPDHRTRYAFPRAQETVDEATNERSDATGGVPVLHHPFPSFVPVYFMERILGGHSGTDRSPPFPAVPLPRQDTPRRGTPKALSSFRPMLTKSTDGDAVTWSEFLHFYSRGAWDPQKVPVVPKRSSRAPGARSSLPLLSNPSAATQSPGLSTEESSETIHHAPLTFGDLTSSQLDDSVMTCSLPSVFTQSVIPQGDNFESLGYLAAPFAPRMSPPEPETYPFMRSARRTRPETSTLSLQRSTFYQRS